MYVILLESRSPIFLSIYLLTFHERGSKSRFLYWSIWDKLDVQLVPSRFDIIWHFVSAKSTKFCWSGIGSVSYFNIIVNTVVVIFNLKKEKKKNGVYILNLPIFITIIFAGLQIGFFGKLYLQNETNFAYFSNFNVIVNTFVVILNLKYSKLNVILIRVCILFMTCYQ